MEANVILLSFDQQALAYQALSEIKQAGLAGRVDIASAAVVERQPDGTLRIKDGFGDGATASGSIDGSLLGALIGVLGGPLGVLLGGLSGALLGGAWSLDATEARVALLEQMGVAVPAGATALLVLAREPAVEVIDGIATQMNAVVLRRPAAAVQAEVDAVKDAQEAAVTEARRVLRERQKDEWREKFDGWKNEIGERWAQLRHKLRDGAPDKG
ncbi:MAG: hypothetical protein QM766_01725 [Burkholderiaceae bacterium]